VKVRLHGTRAEVTEATRRLVKVVDVVAISEPYPDRGASLLVRVYLEVRLDPPGSTPSAGSGRPAPPAGRGPPFEW
jgi:hypothetical protein